ncbi:unnamed protein product [Hermetia illucens]|uniref:Uncharacterized protein n=1 Tax=Hermetia illucens TaxID=343691 RepID=A0A7R8YZR0_HERIL|nr:unnamed protein product [Hermetia illucens]
MVQNNMFEIIKRKTIDYKILKTYRAIECVPIETESDIFIYRGESLIAKVICFWFLQSRFNLVLTVLISSWKYL